MASTILADNGVSSGSAGIKTTADSTGALALQTTTAGGAATTAVTIDTSQNVGIGTSSPASIGKLAVVGGNGNGIVYQSTGGVQNYLGDISGTTAAVGALTNHPTAFYAGAAERMRIDSSGNLFLGTTSTGYQNNNSVYTVLSGGASTVMNHASGTASGGSYFAFGYNAGGIGSITQNGTTAVAYNTTSDYRLKENVQPISGALDRVAALKPCTYTWKSAPDEIGEGFIAHELQEVCPQAVTGEKDAVDEEGNAKYQSIDTSFLVATLTAAIQEQQALITTLTERITALEAK